MIVGAIRGRILARREGRPHSHNDCQTRSQLARGTVRIGGAAFWARFASLEALLEFVLGELLRDDADKLDQAEQSVLEKRLRDLGYL